VGIVRWFFQPNPCAHPLDWMHGCVWSSWWGGLVGAWLGGVTRLDGVLTKPFSSYRAVPVGPKGMSSPIGGGRPSVGSEALSPSVSVGVYKGALVPRRNVDVYAYSGWPCANNMPVKTCPCPLQPFTYGTRPSWSAGGGMTWVGRGGFQKEKETGLA